MATPSQIATTVLTQHAIRTGWIRSSDQIHDLIVEAVELDRQTQTEALANAPLFVPTEENSNGIFGL